MTISYAYEEIVRLLLNKEDYQSQWVTEKLAALLENPEMDVRGKHEKLFRRIQSGLKSFDPQTADEVKFAVQLALFARLGEEQKELARTMLTTSGFMAELIFEGLTALGRCSDEVIEDFLRAFKTFPASLPLRLNIPHLREFSNKTHFDEFLKIIEQSQFNHIALAFPHDARFSKKDKENCDRVCKAIRRSNIKSVTLGVGFDAVSDLIKNHISDLTINLHDLDHGDFKSLAENIKNSSSLVSIHIVDYNPNDTTDPKDVALLRDAIKHQISGSLESLTCTGNGFWRSYRSLSDSITPTLKRNKAIKQIKKIDKQSFENAISDWLAESDDSKNLSKLAETCSKEAYNLIKQLREVSQSDLFDSHDETLSDMLYKEFFDIAYELRSIKNLNQATIVWSLIPEESSYFLPARFETFLSTYEDRREDGPSKAFLSALPYALTPSTPKELLYFGGENKADQITFDIALYEAAGLKGELSFQDLTNSTSKEMRSQLLQYVILQDIQAQLQKMMTKHPTRQSQTTKELYDFLQDNLPQDFDSDNSDEQLKKTWDEVTSCLDELPLMPITKELFVTLSPVKASSENQEEISYSASQSDSDNIPHFRS